MAYRVNVQFKDGSTNGAAADIVAAATPRRGDMIFVARKGQPVSARVTAIWTPSSKGPGSRADGLVMVEAQEV